MGRISMPQGKGSQMHNRREYEKIGQDIPENIDVTKTKDNIIIMDMDVKEAYQSIFGEAVKKYNEKQKRADRKINDYYTKILHSKNGEKPFYEDVLQWGKKEDFENNEQLRQTAKEALKKYAEDFQQRNPNLKVIGAYIHMDEASPHLHLDYIPVASGYKQGMSIRNSLDKALEQQGIEVKKDRRRTVKDKETGKTEEVTLDEGRFNNRTMAWKEREREYFEDICKELNLEVEAAQKARGSLSVAEYKEAKDRMIEPLLEQSKALKEGGSFTNDRGEEQFIGYDESIEYLENSQKQMAENALAYKEGGFFYDHERGKGVSIPEGGAEQAVKQAEATTIKAKKEADAIIRNANEKAEKLIDTLGAYETAQKAQIDTEVEKYASEQKKALEGKLEPLRGELATTQDHIKANKDILAKQYAEYQTREAEQTARLDKVSRELDQKKDELVSLDKVGAKLTHGADIYEMDVSDGFMKKKTVTVIEGYTPEELNKVFQRADFHQTIKNTLDEANTKAQGIIDNAVKQGSNLLAKNQQSIDRANSILANEQERRKRLDAYEKTVKATNAELTAQNEALTQQRAALQADVEGLQGLKEQHKQLADEVAALQSRFERLNVDVERKTAFVEAELSQDTLKQMLDNSVVTNLVQDTMFQTCLQLEQQGLIQNGSMAFMKLNKKPILERFKEQVPDFVQKVKDHMQELATRVVHHSRRR